MNQCPHTLQPGGRCSSCLALDVYQRTVERIESSVSPIDRDGALTSIAISLKRIADTLDVITDVLRNGGTK